MNYVKNENFNIALPINDFSKQLDNAVWKKMGKKTKNKGRKNQFIMLN